MNPVHFSSASEEWATPQDFFDKLNAEFQFTLDPCSTHESAKCERHYTRAEDGLKQSWKGERVFMNPPYGEAIAEWIFKAHCEVKYGGAIVVALLPARTDTDYWHRFIIRHEIRFIRGRLQFSGMCKGTAPFPSAVVVMRPKTI